MVRALHVWEGPEHVGLFRAEGGMIRFEYDPAAESPVSLSMPLSGPWGEEAPRMFLEGLLPESAEARLRMRIALGAPSEHPFDLLESVDSAGGLVFTADGNPPAEVGSEPMEVATAEDIEARIVSSFSLPPSFEEGSRHCRFSLAGAQAKFTLTHYHGRWYWPSACTPSTHIVKPPVSTARNTVEVENATMDLAGLVGLAVPPHGTMRAGGREAYIVERFDRAGAPGELKERMRTEDLTQSMGLSHAAKYDVTIPDVIDILRKADPSGELAYGWLEMLAFNCFAANADAHAKNYSLFLGPHGGVSLCPLYDALTTAYWPHFDGGLAMPFGDYEVFFARELTKDVWAREAGMCGLDEDRVVHIASTVSERVVERAPDAYACLDGRVRERLLGCIAEANGGMARGPARPVARKARGGDGPEEGGAIPPRPRGRI